MSANKNRYYEVITISSVKAKNKTEAMRMALSRNRTNRSSPGAEVLGRVSTVERLPAQDARDLAETLEASS